MWGSYTSYTSHSLVSGTKPHSNRAVEVTAKHAHLPVLTACTQDKAQQLEVVRESLGALKAPPKTGTTLSAVDSRRKAAAMHVLRACTKA